ncbi:MAG: hypothetical protein IIV05_07190, partial [Ruminococcus sp.]|nr:hypothetical protein [Ruminococcus sp.]
IIQHEQKGVNSFVQPIPNFVTFCKHFNPDFADFVNLAHSKKLKITIRTKPLKTSSCFCVTRLIDC